MKKKLFALFMAVCLLATILPMSALAVVDTAMTVVDIQDPVKDNSSYQVIPLNGTTPQTFDYTVPDGGVAIIILYSSDACQNSEKVVNAFATSNLINNDKIKFIAIEAYAKGQNAANQFVEEYIPQNAQSKFDLYYTNNKYLMSKYLNAVFGATSGSFPFVMLVKDGAIRYISSGYQDLLVYQNALSNLLDNVSGVETETINVYGTKHYEKAAEVLELVNAERNKAGAEDLSLSKTLTEAAMQRAAEIAVVFSHTRPDGRGCSSVIPTSYTKTTSGENIAAFVNDPAGVMNAWMNSEGHKQNILSSNYTQIGVGCFESAGKYYWVQVFSNGNDNIQPGSAATSGNVSISAFTTNISTQLTPAENNVTIQVNGTKTYRLENVIRNDITTSYATLVPNVTLDKEDIVSFSISNDGVVTFTGLKAGSATATLRAYDGDAGKTINITVSDSTKTPVTITGVSAATGQVYNGSAQKGYAGTPSSLYSGSYDVSYEGIDGTSYSSSAAPTNAGSYRVTISVPESDKTYTGSISLDFTIGKASITIKADDKQAAIGAAQPSYTYTVTGLAANDTLKTKPTLSCTPDMSKAGTYDIVPSGAVVPDGGNYNSTITYVKGKLTVSDKLTALLKSLSWSAGTMNKGFDPNTTEYVLNLSYWTDSVKLTARADSGLEIKSTGLSYSGYVYPSAGENLTVTFTVSGEGMTETKYTIVVKRAAKPEVYLEDMDISVGKLTPDFNKAETSYKLLLPINEKTVWFDLTASLGASISASGYDETDGGKFAVSVDPGKSQTIRFTVSKGTEAITYVVTVERKEGERITIKDSRNGKITVSDINAEYGDSVYIYVKPETGFALGELSITDSEGVSVKPVKVSENKYLFTMPKENVTIEAIFKIDLRMLPFGDVSLGSWYYDAIFYVYTNGLMEGVDSSSFNPDGTMTRAMIWAVLARIDGVSYITGSNWQTYARSWAMNNDISDGTNPNDPVTREQLVTMLWRFVGEPYSYGGLTGWSDASSVSDWAREAMSWAINDGIITGITSSTIGAKSTATRAQCATILMRFFEAID